MARFARLLAVAASFAVSLTGCGGRTSSAVPPAATAAPVVPVLQQNAVTLTVTIPAATGTSSASRATFASLRSPQYVSSATKSITAALTMVTATSGGANITPSPLPATVVANIPNGTGNAPGSPCVADTGNPGNYICTLKLAGYPGNDTYTIQAWSASGGTGSVLSGGTPTVAVTQGVVNTPASVTLDAKVNALTLLGPSCGTSGAAAVSGTFTGSAATTFTVATTDAASKTIVAPGLPTVTANASGITGGTGAALAVSTSGQTVTVTPTVGASGFVTGTITVTAANPTSDGIPFSVPASFTFSTQSLQAGYLADIEQNLTGGTYNVKYYKITSGSDPFALQNTLTPTTSTNVAKFDVSNPLSLAWNGTGDLLIGNAGPSLTTNAGYLSCVPAAAVTSNAAVSTSYGALTVPSSMAYNAADGSVIVTNNPAALEYAPAPFQDPTVEVSPPPGLTPTYAASVFTPGSGYAISTTRSLAAPGFFANAVAVVSNASPVAYAITRSKGFTTNSFQTNLGEEDSSASCYSNTTGTGTGGTGRSFVDLVRTGGATSHLFDDSANFLVDTPVGLAYDAYDNQLIVANDTSCYGNVAIYGGTSASLVTYLNISNQLAVTEGTGALATPIMVAAAPDGKLAVAYYAYSGYPQIQIYSAPTTQGGASRSALNGPIPFNSVTVNGGGCNGPYIYGNWYADIDSMQWVSATKLVVGVLAVDSTAPSTYAINAKTGLYLFDTSASPVAPTGCDDFTNTTFPPTTPISGFHATSARPRAFAIHP